MAGGVSTWLHSTEKLRRPRARAWRSTDAVGGVVVSKPMARNTTSRSGCCCASFSASMAEYTMRTSAPWLRAFMSELALEAGTRIRSA